MIKTIGLLALFSIFYSSAAFANGSLFSALSSNPILINLNGQGNNQLDARGRYFKPRLQPVNAATRNAILGHERRKRTKYSPSSHSLSRCSLIGSRVELDNRPNTVEQLVTYSKGCQPSPNRLKTAWFVQSRPGSTPKVLMSERASMLRIPKENQAGFRLIESKATSKLTLGVEKKQHAVSCRTVWKRAGGQYRAEPEIIRAWGQVALLPGSSAWYKLAQLYPHMKSRLPKECPKN